jgi:hypothetical protein
MTEHATAPGENSAMTKEDACIQMYPDLRRKDEAI